MQLQFREKFEKRPSVEYWCSD